MRQAAFKLGGDKVAHAFVTGGVDEGELFGTRDSGNNEINALEGELKPFLVTVVDHMDLDTVFGKFAPDLRRKPLVRQRLKKKHGRRNKRSMKERQKMEYVEFNLQIWIGPRHCKRFRPLRALLQA